MRKRKKAALFLTMPIFIFIWFIGWTMTCVGSKQKPLKTKTLKRKELALTLIAPEQEIILKTTPKPKIADESTPMPING